MVSDDVILEQVEYTYDSAGNVIQTVVRQRYHNAPDTQQGSLQNPSTTPKARVLYRASWPDGIGRMIATATYGTNGGTSLSRPSTVPSGSDTILVSRTKFDGAGNTLDMIDPAGMVTRSGYDAAGRKITQIDNYRSSSSSSSSSGGGCAPSDDANRTTEFTYTPDGQQATLVAVNARTGDQTTTWTYGTTLSTSDIASNQLLRSTTYPDSVGGGDVVSYSYNRQGQQRGLTDQRGCVHVYEFDQLGRPTHDRVTTPGSGVDTAVLRLSTSYEVRGMASKLTSWNNASVSSGSVVNECQFVYNTFGQLITDYQEHGGAVNTSTSPKVQYGYANGSANTIRPTTLTYPNGRVLIYGYGTTDGIDDVISRVSSLVDNDGTTPLADYSFVGTGAYVVVDYTQPDVKYTLVDLSGTNDPDTGDIYSGWDRFGRVKDCRWYDYGHSTDVARLKYGYDRASDRLWRADLVAQSLGKNFDELYSYDGLHRLKDMQRGLLNGSNTGVTSENFAQCWSLDPTSNWYGFQEAATGGSSTLVQSRTANKVHEISGITNSVGSAWVTPAYDAAGNTTTLPQPADPTKSYTATYDAWNRLVKLVDTTSSGTVQQNAYDARAFRTKRQDYTSGTLSETRHFYYTSAWQSIEERLGTSPNSANPERQQVWGRRYVDDLVLRDRDTNGDGTLDERLYGLQDANWNVVALINTSATAQERYQYTPFGSPTFLNGTMSTSSPASAVESAVLFTGQRLDPISSLYLFRMRWFDPTTGRFITRDTLGYADSTSLYAAVFAPRNTDPSGLQKRIWMSIEDGFGASFYDCPACEESDVKPQHWTVSHDLRNAVRDACTCLSQAYDLVKNHEDLVQSFYSNLNMATDVKSWFKKGSTFTRLESNLKRLWTPVLEKARNH
jgi:RHS repeat-associated protein